MSIEQQERLEYQINVAVDKIKREFATLQTKIRLSLKEKGVTAQDIAAHVIAFGVAEENKEMIKTEESLEQVFILLTDCWSFLDCDLLDSIVEVYGTNEDHCRMVEYQEKLQNFCKRRISELPSEVLLPKPCSQSQLQTLRREQVTIKLNMSDPRLFVIKEIKKKICKILNADPATLEIKEVKEGCVEVTFFILESVSKLWFNKPLNKEQRDAFRAASVLSLSCGCFQEIFTVSLLKRIVAHMYQAIYIFRRWNSLTVMIRIKIVLSR